MNKIIDYDCFPELKTIVMTCGLETQEDREKAFRSLVKCLVSKNVYKQNGTIAKDRGTCLHYLSQICPYLEEDELNLMIDSADIFYSRFIFAPCEKAKSLFSEFQKMGIKSTFMNIPISDIFEEYRQETSYSPYEKASKEELYSFISSVKESMYALA